MEYICLRKILFGFEQLYDYGFWNKVALKCQQKFIKYLSPNLMRSFTTTFDALLPSATAVSGERGHLSGRSNKTAMT